MDQQNVKDPIEYIQLDHAQLRADMIELGIDPEEFFNVWRLTPAVYDLGEQGWAVKTRARLEDTATDDNARYCLDVVVAILVNQQSRKNIRRWPAHLNMQVRLLRRQAVLSRASTDANPTGTLEAGTVCKALYCVSDFSGQNQFVFVFTLVHDPAALLSGYIPREACEIEVVPREDAGARNC